MTAKNGFTYSFYIGSLTDPTEDMMSHGKQLMTPGNTFID